MMIMRWVFSCPRISVLLYPDESIKRSHFKKVESQALMKRNSIDSSSGRGSMSRGKISKLMNDPNMILQAVEWQRRKIGGGGELEKTSSSLGIDKDTGIHEELDDDDDEDGKKKRNDLTE
jgi:hypothetical protein